MTVYSNTSTGDKSESENQSSTEIRAEIDQTRASVGDKIDQLQARLDPNRLKQQAQETVQEMITDTANSMTEYVRVHKDEMVTSLADAARRNPLPTALVGLGIGWLILESFAGKRQEEERPSYRPSRGSGSYQGATGRSYVSQGRGQYMESDYYSPEYFAENDWGRSGYPASYPLEYENQGQQPYRQSGEQGYSHSSGNGHQQGGNPVARATNAVKDSMGDVGDRVGGKVEDVKDSVGGAMDNVKDSVAGAVDNVKNSVSGAVEDVSQRVGDTVEDVKGRVNEAMGGVRHQVDQMGYQTQRTFNRAGNQMEHWQERARYEGQRRGQQAVSHLEDNPLIYGAVALAAGAAIGLLLPQTRAENRAFGEYRDQMMAKGQEVFETAKVHAQQVVEEVRPELEEKARQIVSDVTETGKAAVKDAADELKPIVDKAVSKSKEEARSAAQDLGVNPDKLPDLATAGKSPSSTSSSTSGSASSATSGNASGQKTSASSSQPVQSKMPVINRDTLAGQWKQVQGEFKKKWGQLTDDDLMKIEGNYDKLVGTLQSRYGYSREHAEREVNTFFDSTKA